MWQIHSWDESARIGAVRSPHFGPLPFSAGENPKGTDDFVVGEEVVVMLAGRPDEYRVESVREVRPKPQPAGTHCPDFDVIHAARFWDASVDQEADSLVFWFGRCCSQCEPGIIARFTGVTHWSGDHDDWGFDRPLLRFASQAEVRVHELPTSEGVAYCVVPEPLRAADDTKDPLFIVAKKVRVEVHRREMRSSHSPKNRT